MSEAKRIRLTLARSEDHPAGSPLQRSSGEMHTFRVASVRGIH